MRITLIQRDRNENEHEDDMNAVYARVFTCHLYLSAIIVGVPYFYKSLTMMRL